MNSNKRKRRKIFILFVVIVITTVVLIVGTYAWFVGISTVNVSQFNVAISAGDGLEISLSGADNSWKKGSQVLNITKNGVTSHTASGDHTYEGHTNIWADELIPLSSSGALNTTKSRLELYEKSSLSATAGGYRIIADSVSNMGDTEADGYIAFDLFIKNGKGNSYDSSPVEDIFLSKYSYAESPVQSTPNLGVENSIRVGFFALGDVPTVNAQQSDLTALNCNSTHGLCTNVLGTTYNIWEPNNGRHATGLVDYYNSICKKRTGASTYGSSCLPLDVGSNKRTYAINSQITTSNNIVDIYDGGDLNSYTSTTKLTKMNTYKTTDATSVGSSKASLLKLPGNSITKVRVYIWLEGQDIDNYDIISDQSIDIKFGFTKDRYGIDETADGGASTGTRASSFEDDSWATIQSNIRSNNPANTSQYHVGDTREVRIGGNSYTLRLANKSTDSNCSGSSYSQTACGFVVEFADIVERRKMNSTATNVGGWPGSELYTYLQGDFYNSLPDDLKKVIIQTKVISGHGTSDSSNFTTTDKLYLLSGKEIFGSDSYDTAASTTHQLQYYSSNNVTTSINNSYAIKQYNGSKNWWWWLRPAYSSDNAAFRFVGIDGYLAISGAIVNGGGLAPAFRIG